MGKFDKEHEENKEPSKSQKTCAAHGCPLMGSGSVSGGWMTCFFHGGLDPVEFDPVTTRVIKSQEFLQRIHLIKTGGCVIREDLQKYPKNPDLDLQPGENYMTYSDRLFKVAKQYILQGVNKIQPGEPEGKKSGPRKANELMNDIGYKDKF